MKRAVVLGALVVVGGLALVNAQPKPDEPKVVTVEKVKDNLFVLRGGGGNTFSKGRKHRRGTHPSLPSEGRITLHMARSSSLTCSTSPQVRSM